jgi:hypothetical protein
VSLWRTVEHEPLAGARWDDGLVEAEVSAIVADAERAGVDGIWPCHPLDEEDTDSRFRSFYLGSAGMIWGLARLGSSFDGRQVIEDLLADYRRAPDFAPDDHPASLWMGETGLLVTAAEIGSTAADADRLGDLIDANREHGTWELMWGSPGTMLAARACGLSTAYRDSAEVLWDRRDPVSGLWHQALYGRVAQILGPAHGFAGNVHALRGLLGEDVLRAHVTAVLERTALHHDGLVNWPPEAAPAVWPELEIRVQWCHGAPGILTTLGDLMPTELALGAGALVWEAGPLRKGPSLCHGTAGNGFALLRLFELTGDELWLDRARRFAMHAIAQTQAARARYGRGRYSLWTGDIGVALYLNACRTQDPAFPSIDDL